MIGIYIVKKIVQPNPVVIFVSSQARTTCSFARFESQDLRVASVCWHQRMRRALKPIAISTILHSILSGIVAKDDQVLIWQQSVSIPQCMGE